MGPVPSLWGVWLDPRAWQSAFSPSVAALLGAVAVGYAVGVARQRGCTVAAAESHADAAERAARGGSGAAGGRIERRRVVDPSVVATPARQVLCYGGLAIVALAIMSPLDVLAQWLFSAHMSQHLLLLVCAPPLLVASAPLDPLLRALPERLCARAAACRSSLGTFAPARRIAELVVSPWGAMAIFVATMWIWHLPGLYDLTLSNLPVHGLEHITFLAAGLLWWSRLINCPPLHAPLSTVTASMPATMAFLLGTVAQNVVLAMVIGFAAHPLYAPYAALAQRPGGLSALADQELGASFMWTLGDLPFSIALARLVHLWMSNLEAEEEVLADHVANGC